MVEGIDAVAAALPIQLGQRHAHLLVDHLQRLLQLGLPKKAAAQNFMLVHRGLPRLAEARYVQPLDIDTHLVDVVAALAVKRLEQHALLHGRQRV